MCWQSWILSVCCMGFIQFSWFVRQSDDQEGCLLWNICYNICSKLDPWNLHTSKVVLLCISCTLTHWLPWCTLELLHEFQHIEDTVQSKSQQADGLHWTHRWWIYVEFVWDCWGRKEKFHVMVWWCYCCLCNFSINLQRMVCLCWVLYPAEKV